MTSSLASERATVQEPLICRDVEIGWPFFETVPSSSLSDMAGEHAISFRAGYTPSSERKGAILAGVGWTGKLIRRYS